LEIVAVVSDLRRDFDGLPFDDWVERVRSTFLPEVLASAAYQGAYRVANLEVFFRSVIQQMSESGGDAHLLVRKLRDAIATQQEAEEARPSEDVGAVQLMTIHKSKGLAFEHTYMVDLHHNFRTGGRRTGTCVEPGVGIQLVGLWPPGFESSWSRSADVEEAERIKIGGTGSEVSTDVVPQEVEDAMREVSDTLLGEVQRSLDFYRATSSSTPIDKVVLCGGSAQVPGLTRLLEERIELPIEVADPFVKVNASSANVDEESLRELSPALSVAMGLGMRSLNES